MAVISHQLTTSTTVAPVISGAGLVNLSGALADPLPLQIKNIDASITIYIGGPTVTSSNGYPLLAGQSITMNFIQNEITTLYCVAASGTPILAIMTARQ